MFVPTKEDGTKTRWFTVMDMGAMLLCIKVPPMQPATIFSHWLPDSYTACFFSLSSLLWDRTSSQRTVVLSKM